MVILLIELFALTLSRLYCDVERQQQKSTDTQINFSNYVICWKVLLRRELAGERAPRAFPGSDSEYRKFSLREPYFSPM